MLGSRGSCGVAYCSGDRRCVLGFDAVFKLKWMIQMSMGTLSIDYDGDTVI